MIFSHNVQTIIIVKFIKIIYNNENRRVMFTVVESAVCVWRRLRVAYFQRIINYILVHSLPGYR